MSTISSHRSSLPPYSRYPDAMEKPRLVFAFGAAEDSYFIGCGEAMEWNKLPAELDFALRTRALEVRAISLGENDAFYCRYVAKRSRAEYTITGNIPSTLKLLLNAWWMSNQETPDIVFGQRGAYYFQRHEMTIWERMPKRLDDILGGLKADPDQTTPPRSLSLGRNGSYILLTEGYETDAVNATWDGLDDCLTEKMESLVLGEKRVIENACLSLYTTEDYVLTFTDNSIFYSVSNFLLPTIEKFVKLYHDSLIRHNNAVQRQLLHPPPSIPEEPVNLELPADFMNWDPSKIDALLQQAVPASSRSSASGDSSPTKSRSPARAPMNPATPMKPEMDAGFRKPTLTKRSTWGPGQLQGIQETPGQGQAQYGGGVQASPTPGWKGRNAFASPTRNGFSSSPTRNPAVSPARSGFSPPRYGHLTRSNTFTGTAGGMGMGMGMGMGGMHPMDMGLPTGVIEL